MYKRQAEPKTDAASGPASEPAAEPEPEATAEPAPASAPADNPDYPCLLYTSINVFDIAVLGQTENIGGVVLPDAGHQHLYIVAVAAAARKRQCRIH